MKGLSDGKTQKSFDDMLSHFNMAHEHDRWTDRTTVTHTDCHVTCGTVIIDGVISAYLLGQKLQWDDQLKSGCQDQ